MDARHAFASLLLLTALVGLAFLGVSLAAAMQRHDLALWGHHPLFGSGIASVIVTPLGVALLAKFGWPDARNDQPSA